MVFVNIWVILLLWLLGTSVIAFFIYALDLKKSHGHIEAYHSIIQKQEGCIFTETKIIRSPFSANVDLPTLKNYTEKGKTNPPIYFFDERTAHPVAGRNRYAEDAYQSTKEIQSHGQHKPSAQLDVIA